MNKNPSTRIALVTGGSRGIGAGVCRTLLEAGYTVAIGYQHQQAKAEEIARDFDKAFAVQIDIGDAASVKTAFKTIRKEAGEVDVLVNNAALGPEKPFLQITDEEWAEVFSVNVTGAVRCIREALPAMQQKQFGRIINMSSIAGQWGGLYRVHYAASKAALINLSCSLAKLYSKDGITANAIAPGMIATDLMTEELAKPESKDKLKTIPIGRLGTCEEVGAAVLYLASDEAAYITGQTLNLNGGMYFG